VLKGMKFGQKLRFLQVFVWGEGYLRYKREETDQNGYRCNVVCLFPT
jgi:hypothetical protein